MGRAATPEAFLTLLDLAARAALRAAASLPGAPPADAIPVQADGGPAMEATQAAASFASAANRFRAKDPRRGWAAFGMGTEARAGVILRFCPEPRREIALAETTLHLALARRGQGMPSDRARLAAAAAVVEAAHALRPEPMTAVLSDLLRRADDPGECLIALAARAAGAESPPARRAARDGAPGRD